MMANEKPDRKNDFLVQPSSEELKAKKLAKAKLDREKIERKLAKWREEEKAKASFFGSAAQPAVNTTRESQSTGNRKALAAKIVEAHREEFTFAAPPEPEPEEEPKAEEQGQEEPPKRFQFDEAATTPTLFKNTPLDNAKAFARDRLRKGGALAMYRYREGWWQWNGRFYETAPEERISAMVYPYLDSARDPGGERFKPKPDHANELIKCLKALVAVDDRDEPPCWLAKTPAELLKRDAKRLLVFRNCLIDVMTGEVIDLTPRLWAHGGADFNYNPKATCPRWEQFLEEVFPSDPESQMTVEEQLGYGMTTDTRFEKGAAWIGEKRSGKSTLAWVQEKLCGSGACVSLSFHDWTKTENSHEHLIGRKVGIFSDVRLRPGKWYGQNYDPGGLDHDSKQLVLKITGRDRITIKRKYIAPWIGYLFIKLILTSNEVLNLQDSVLISRFIYLYFGQSFFGREDINLRSKLEAELPGIANRCLAAYRRLLARGKFIQPVSGKPLIQEVEEKVSAYAAFMNQCFVEDPNGQVTCAGFYLLFRDWCEANGYGRLLQSITGANQLIRQVNKIDRWADLASIQPNNTRVYPGIRKKEP
jgi:putative DNA primase/helicase